MSVLTFHSLRMSLLFRFLLFTVAMVIRGQCVCSVCVHVCALPANVCVLGNSFFPLPSQTLTKYR